MIEFIINLKTENGLNILSKETEINSEDLDWSASLMMN